MERARVSVPPDAIRIEDEVWQEAFRETTRAPARPRLRSLDGGRAPRPARRPVGAPQLAAQSRPPVTEVAHSSTIPDTAVRRTVTITVSDSAGATGSAVRTVNVSN